MRGILNGKDPDAGDYARAPQLAVLAGLAALSRVATLALLAAHPDVRDTRHDPRIQHAPLASATIALLEAASHLRFCIVRYADHLGVERLWRP